MKRLLAALVLLAVVGAAAAGWGWWRLHQPYRGYVGESVTVEVERGLGASEILRRLEEAGVIFDARLARLYLVYHLGDPPLKAGEYRFQGHLTTPEALAKLLQGAVVTYPVTLVEGLTLEETADSLARSGFGEREALLAAMRSPDLISDLDPEATDLEGYLFPETYLFARGTSEEEVVATLVRTFRRHLETEVPPEGTRLIAGHDLRRLVTLASIVEKEARLDEERALIAGVYAHRLRLGMPLQADPTVIFARKRLGLWDGDLRRPDLQMDSPYNTYRYAGLPPGPIASPGLKSLQAAAAPPDVPYLYFVSRNDGSHVFSRNLREHNRAVEQWQRRYWRERWARERQEKEPKEDPGSEGPG